MVHRMLDVAKDVDVVIHLGDDYRDCTPFIDAGVSLIRVPGTWGLEYQDPMIDNRRFEEFMDLRFFLTHTPTKDAHDLPDDMNPAMVIQDQLCDIFCHGHTHEPKISKSNGVVILNPGHLKSDRDRGFDASYSRITMTPATCDIQLIHEQTGEVMDHVNIHRTV